MNRRLKRRRVSIEDRAWKVELHDLGFDVPLEQIVDDLTSAGVPARRDRTSSTLARATTL